MQNMIRTAIAACTMETLTRTFLLCFLAADCRLRSPSPSSQGRQSSLFGVFLLHLSLGRGTHFTTAGFVGSLVVKLRF